MIFDYTDPVAFLKERLAEKAKANPSYSMRAFAKKLELSAGGLSLILGRKKRLSAERAAEIARALELEDKEAEYFVLLNQLGTAKSASYRTQILEKIHAIRATHGHTGSDHTVLSVDQFRMISEWYGFACLELITRVSNKQGWGSRQISERLGITPAEADAMVERLKRLGLVNEIEPGKFVRTATSVTVSSEVPNEALRSYYESVHQRSQDSIRSQGPDAKAIGAQVFAFDPADLPQIKKLMDEYLLALGDLAVRGKNRTEIYQAVANIFRATTPAQQSAVDKPSKTSKAKSVQSSNSNKIGEINL